MIVMIPQPEPLPVPSLQDFAWWALFIPINAMMLALHLLVDDIQPKGLIDDARGLNLGDATPEFVQVLLDAVPGAEADAVIQARATLLREVAEFSGGEQQMPDEFVEGEG